MSAAIETAPPEGAAAGFVARFEGLRRRLPGDGEARERAAASLRAHGLPHVGEEGWRYTALRALERQSFEEALTPVGEETEAPALLASLDLPDAPRLVFVDGRYAPELSRPPVDRPGLRVRRFTDSPLFEGAARPDRERFVALNTMLTEDGIDLAVDEDVDAGVVLLVSIGAHALARPIAYHPRHRVALAPGARLRLVEVATGSGIYLHNAVLEIAVGAGAHLSHVRLQDEGPDAFHVSTAYVDAAERATYDGFTLNLGASLARTEIHARLGGPGGIVHLNGAQMIGRTQHADFTTVVAHDAPECASRQTVKNVLSGRSRGVFQGRIEVARAAQRTDGYQMNQALLLSPDAEIDCKPELRIHADDVKCSHGATVGAIDEDQMFYLQSRGIPRTRAQAMLVRAFLSASIDAVEDEVGRGLLERAVDGWWTRETRARRAAAAGAPA